MVRLREVYFEGVVLAVTPPNPSRGDSLPHTVVQVTGGGPHFPPDIVTRRDRMGWYWDGPCRRLVEIEDA